MGFTHPLSALLVDIEASELNAQLPSMADLLYEFPHIAHVLEMCCEDVLSFAARVIENDRVVLDASALGVRVGAWRKLAQDALAITEKA